MNLTDATRSIKEQTIKYLSSYKRKNNQDINYLTVSKIKRNNSKVDASIRLLNKSTICTVDMTYPIDSSGNIVFNNIVKNKFYNKLDKISASIDDYDTISDDVEELQDKMDDLQDQVEEIDMDDPNLDIENNISDHYIAECDSCHGIFISSVMQSDQDIDSISGICPICQKETTQYLNWVIKDADNI